MVLFLEDDGNEDHLDGLLGIFLKPLSDFKYRDQFHILSLQIFQLEQLF